MSDDEITLEKPESVAAEGMLSPAEASSPDEVSAPAETSSTNEGGRAVEASVLVDAQPVVLERVKNKRQTPKKKKGAAQPAAAEASAQKPPVSYLPVDILARLGKNDVLRKAYLEEARQLALNIRQWGLGQALCLLLAAPQRSCNYRLYRDLTRWLAKEHKLKARRYQGLMESLVYGSPLYLLQATQGSLLFVDKLLRVPAPPRKKRPAQPPVPTQVPAAATDSPPPDIVSPPLVVSTLDTATEETRSNPTHD